MFFCVLKAEKANVTPPGSPITPAGKVLRSLGQGCILVWISIFLPLTLPEFPIFPTLFLFPSFPPLFLPYSPFSLFFFGGGALIRFYFPIIQNLNFCHSRQGVGEQNEEYTPLVGIFFLLYFDLVYFQIIKK